MKRLNEGQAAVLRTLLARRDATNQAISAFVASLWGGPAADVQIQHTSDGGIRLERQRTPEEAAEAARALVEDG